MKYLFTTYPRLLLYSCSISLAYVLYHYGDFDWIAHNIDGFDHVSVFVCGLLYSFGFTAPLATAYLVAIAPHVSPMGAAIIAGAGSALGDFGIFQFVSFSLHDEFATLRTTAFAKRVYAILHHETVPEKFRRLWQYVLAGVIIASPLPDEIGISMLAGFTNIEGRRLTLLCFVLSTLGILAILLLAR